jgi:hypothetical protein
MDGDIQVGSYIVCLSVESRNSETVEVTEQLHDYTFEQLSH